MSHPISNTPQGKAYLDPNQVALHKKEILESLHETYPYFFVKNMPYEVNIPLGWLKHFEKTLHAFAATGLCLVIENIGVYNGEIRIYYYLPKNITKEEESHISTALSTPIALFSQLLRGITSICIICGEEAFRSENYGLCAECATHFDIQLPERRRRHL